MRNDAKEFMVVGCENVYWFEVTHSNIQCDKCNESPGFITMNLFFTQKVIV
jgi:hypothetical protein